MVAKLVDTVKAQQQRTLERRLLDAEQLCPLQFFAQEHTEHRRLHRVFHRDFRQADPRAVRTGRNQQLMGGVEAAKREDQLVAVRLKNLVDARADERFAELCF